MRHNNSLRPGIITGFILSAQVLCISSFSQGENYQVQSRETELGIGFVNVGVLGKNTGTVSDESGNFNLGFAEISDNDSLRFSMIGYEPRTLCVSQLKSDSTRTVFLKVLTYKLPELTVIFPKGREIILGTPVFSHALKSGFQDNNLGSELGIKVNARKRMKLRDLHFNVGICTFDTVTYRLNVYQLSEQSKWENILRNPVYLTFTGDQIGEVVTFDLKEFGVIIEGETIITLEHFRDLGEGKLLFLTQFFTGTTYHRKSKEADWTLSPGQVGMYVHGQTLK